MLRFGDRCLRNITEDIQKITGMQVAICMNSVTKSQLIHQRIMLMVAGSYTHNPGRTQAREKATNVSKEMQKVIFVTVLKGHNFSC